MTGRIYCTPSCHAHCIGMGPISGLQGVAHEVMRTLGVEPDDHRAAAMEVEQAIAEASLDTAREVLAEHGLLPESPQDLT